MSIKYVKGDLFKYIRLNNNQKLICHICNNIKSWGSGFVIPLGEHFPQARIRYLTESKLNLGDTQFINCDNICIANMIAQKGIISEYNRTPIKYTALAKCMDTIRFMCQTRHIDEIHAPAFGSLRSGGHWPFIHKLIEEIWTNITVNIYYLDDNQKKDLEKPFLLEIR